MGDNMNKIYAQLWSVQDYTAKDFFGTLKQLKDMGYAGVEFAGYGNIEAKTMKARLDELGLYGISSHVGIDRLTNNLEAEIEYLNVLGAKYIVCPGAEINNVENALKYAEIFTRIGERCKDAGLTFAYHNHAHEFVLDEGQYPLDVLFKNADSKYVQIQPDLFWVAYAGLNPIQYLIQNLDRIPVIHLKQIKDMETKANVDAGSGLIDFAEVIRLAPNADFVYEQEEFVGTSIENMEKSMKYFSSI